jgi:hypothetical protein
MKGEIFMLRYIYTHEIEPIARRVWFARRDKATRFDTEKRATFQAMGLEGMSTQFPMRPHEWTACGEFEFARP